jgi:inorganic pyrophosphatase
MAVSRPIGQEQMELPDRVTVVIEVPRGGWVKRRADGRVRYVSPVPCPFDYGSVPGISGGDGDPLDAVVLGPGHLRGARVDVPVRGVVRFVDAGRPDDKLVCADHPPTRAERWLVVGFFRFYARAKRLLRAVGLGRPAAGHGDTRYLAYEERR